MTVLRIVNMIPRSLSGEAAQDSEPNLAVNPEDPQQIVATAFTSDPFNGPNAPVFVSTDGGLTWMLRSIVPGGPVMQDISVGFGSSGGALYAGTLNCDTTDPKVLRLNVLRTSTPLAQTPMTKLVDRAHEDQPWVSAATVPDGRDAGQDRVFIGHNDFNAKPATASVETSRDARTAAAPAGFSPKRVERRETTGHDGPPIRTAVHLDGTVYATFHRWRTMVAETKTFTDVLIDIVVVRDDNWAQADPGFSDLTDADDGAVGSLVATGRFVRLTTSVGPLGQERIGADLSLAVDPGNSANVYVAWCDRVGRQTGTDWTLHVRRSTDRGLTWSVDDLQTVTNAKNPALAVNSDGTTGLLFQQLTGADTTARWVTQLQVTGDAWQTAPTTMTLHTALASDPPRTGLPYLGDYLRLLSIGRDFYGVFSGSNRPDESNFPSKVTYQRNANWTSHTLLNTDNASPVQTSIDPFFVHYTP